MIQEARQLLPKELWEKRNYQLIESAVKEKTCELITKKITDTIKPKYPDTESFQSYMESNSRKVNHKSIYNNISHMMYGVVKTKIPGILYDLDLIISQFLPETYIDLFDYDLCKAFIPLKKEIINQLSCDDIVLDNKFIEEVKNKTITVNADSFMSTKELISSIENHYKRIQAKYPDYSFKIKDFTRFLSPEEKEVLTTYVNTSFKTIKQTKSKSLLKL